jgi:hypothetical protein
LDPHPGQPPDTRVRRIRRRVTSPAERAPRACRRAMDATRGYRPRRATVKASPTAPASPGPQYLSDAVPAGRDAPVRGGPAGREAPVPGAEPCSNRAEMPPLPAHLPTETPNRPEYAFRPWLVQIHRTSRGFADWNDTLTAWAIRVMRASARRTVGRSDCHDVGRCRCRPAMASARSRIDPLTPGPPRSRPETLGRAGIPSRPDTPGHPDTPSQPDARSHPDTPSHPDARSHPDTPPRPAAPGLKVRSTIRVPPAGRPHVGASVRHGTRPRSRADRPLQPLQPRRRRRRRQRQPRPPAPGMRSGAARRAGRSARLRAASGREPGPPGIGRLSADRCGAWGHSGPRARLGEGRCGDFPPRRVPLIRSTRPGSSPRGTLRPCAPRGLAAVPA